MVNKKSPGTNLVRNKYNAISTNHVICIDETSLGAYGTLLLALDLASRCIICHCYHSEGLDQHLVVEMLSEAFRKRSFLPPVQIVHSDRGSLFKNAAVTSFLAKEGIKHSRGSSDGHQNQAIERLNRSFKDILRTSLLKGWRQMKKDPLKQQSLSLTDFSALVNECVVFYNNRPHSSLQGSTPNEMEEALFKAHKNEHPKGVILHNSASMEYKDFQTRVLNEYQGDWVRFFEAWIVESRENHGVVVTKLETVIDNQVTQAAEAKEQYESLYSKYLQIQRDLEKVLEESLIAKEARESKEARKLAYNSRKKVALREVITEENLTLILSLVRGRSSFQVSRRRLGLILLYLTGLRVSNLLLLTIQNVRDLFSEGRIKISLIKGGAPRFDLVVSSKDRKHLAKNYQIDLANLSRNTGNNDASALLFTNEAGICLSREYLDKELNKILQKASILLHKHLRTHSFRASYVTDFLEVHDLHEVQELVGHKSITSTLEYRRSRLSIKDRSRMLKERPNRLKRGSVDNKPS